MIRRGLAVAVIAIACAASLLAGCGGSNEAATAAATDAAGLPTDLGEITDLTGRTEITVDVIDNSYKPKAFKVSPGTRITFRNTGVSPHDVTANDDGAFPKLDLTVGKAGVIVAPQSPETYRFHCTLHGGKASGQRGAMIVVPLT